MKKKIFIYAVVFLCNALNASYAITKQTSNGSMKQPDALAYQKNKANVKKNINAQHKTPNVNLKKNNSFEGCRWNKQNKMPNDAKQPSAYNKLDKNNNLPKKQSQDRGGKKYITFSTGILFIDKAQSLIIMEPLNSNEQKFQRKGTQLLEGSFGWLYKENYFTEIELGYSNISNLKNKFERTENYEIEGVKHYVKSSFSSSTAIKSSMLSLTQGYKFLPNSPLSPYLSFSIGVARNNTSINGLINIKVFDNDDIKRFDTMNIYRFSTKTSYSLMFRPEFGAIIAINQHTKVKFGVFYNYINAVKISNNVITSGELPNEDIDDLNAKAFSAKGIGAKIGLVHKF